MATVRIHLDTRSVRKDGTSPLKINVYHKGKMCSIGLDAHVKARNWDEALSRVVGLPDRASLNEGIRKRRVEAEGVLLRLESEGLLDRMDASGIRDAILGKEPRTCGGTGFSAAFRRFMGQKSNPGTKGLYAQTLAKLYAFCPGLDGVRYEDITRGWLADFDAFLARTSPSRNARNIHLRNIRAVFNYAIDEDYTSAYPFRRFRIKPEETRKRSLTVEQLRLLRDYPCEPHQAEYRDIFMLMFYLIGINPADLLRARKSDVRDGRLEYRRAKTGKLYSVRIEPEARAVIDRYAGKGDSLLDVADRYGDYRDFMHRMNRELKRIGTMERKGRGGKKFIEPAFPGLSAYWARHSWATAAYSLDIPMDTISRALGHETGSPVTAIYIALDPRKVDNANRKVLDRLRQEG